MGEGGDEGGAGDRRGRRPVTAREEPELLRGRGWSCARAGGQRDRRGDTPGKRPVRSVGKGEVPAQSGEDAGG